MDHVDVDDCVTRLGLQVFLVGPLGHGLRDVNIQWGEDVGHPSLVNVRLNAAKNVSSILILFELILKTCMNITMKSPLT